MQTTPSLTIVAVAFGTAVISLEAAVQPPVAVSGVLVWAVHAAALAVCTLARSRAAIVFVAAAAIPVLSTQILAGWAAMSLHIVPVMVAVAVWRRHHSHTDVRAWRQANWLALALATGPVLALTTISTTWFGQLPILTAGSLAAAAWLAALGFAIAAGERWGSSPRGDRTISLTIAGAGATLTVALPIVVCLAIIRMADNQVTQFSWVGVWAAVLVGAVAAVFTFPPAWQWASRWSARAFDQDRFLALAAVREHAARARDTFDPATALKQALIKAWRANHIRPLFATPGVTGYVDAAGTPTSAEPAPGQTATTVVVHGRAIGVVLHEATLSPGLVQATLAEASLLYENAALEVAMRRQQTARRQLERDLHDGLQGRLVAVALDLATTLEQDQNGPLSAQLVGAVAQLQSAIAELRQLAHGVHPSTLHDASLAVALRSYAEQMPLPVHIEVNLPPLAPDVARALYYTACEAITNACKHAKATTVVITGTHTESAVSIAIRDNGLGGAQPSGAGLRGVAERLAAVGGQLHITSTAAGTCVTGQVPCVW